MTARVSGRTNLAKRGSMFAVAATLMTALGCGRSPSVQIDGSSTVYPISEAAAEAFREEEPEIRVTVGVSGTGGGFKKFSNGEIDVCEASREIKEIESNACEKAGIDYIVLRVAFDGLAVVVNNDNTWCDELTVEQLRELWQPGSTVKKWSDLNPDWPNKEITLYGPDTESGTFDYFTKVIVGEEDASRSDFTQSANDNVLVTGVTEDPYALAYFGYAYYAANVDRLKLVGVSEDGKAAVKPSLETVRDGSYSPLSRPLYLYVRKSALQRPEVKRFIGFYLENADDFAKKVQYVPTSEQVRSENNERFASATSAAG